MGWEGAKNSGFSRLHLILYDIVWEYILRNSICITIFAKWFTKTASELKPEKMASLVKWSRVKQSLIVLCITSWHKKRLSISLLNVLSLLYAVIWLALFYLKMQLSWADLADKRSVELLIFCGCNYLNVLENSVCKKWPYLQMNSEKSAGLHKIFSEWAFFAQIQS